MFSLKPSALAAEKLKNIQADKVRNSILFLMNEYINKTQIKSHDAEKACRNIEHLKYLSPEIHFIHHQLQISMRQQDVEAAKKNFELLTQNILDEKQEKKYISTTTIGSSEWEKFVIAEAMYLTKKDCGEEAEIKPLSSNEIVVNKDYVQAALCIIARHDPNMYDELMTHVKDIKLFNGKVTMGFTDVRILGAMLIRTPRTNIDPVLYFVEHIVHEGSHIHLNCLMAASSLILNTPDERFVSPLRSDPRPMIGVYHATYVSAKISRTFLQIYEATKNRNLLQTLAETIDETIRGVAEIEKNAKLTSEGWQLIESIKDLVSSVKSMPEWKEYKFLSEKTHRFGAGSTKVNALYEAVA